MKGTLAVSLLVIAVLALMVGPAMAGKPLQVIERSNGFPSGMHFNLNIHGKDWEACQAVPDVVLPGEDDVWGNSIFIPETGTATIQYVSNKKSSVYELTVLDPCAGFDGKNDVAKVQLPYKVQVEGVPTAAGGYYVFGRILGTPNNGPNDSPSTILIYPTFVVQACDWSGIEESEFGSLRDCLLAGDLALGLITTQGNLYGASEEEFVRFPNPEPEKGKGKSKGKEITQLFMWSGYVTDNVNLDQSGPEGVPDGYLDEWDVPMEWDLGADPYNGNENGVIDEFELTNWLEYLVSVGDVIYYEDEWIFDIADLVIAGQTIINEGTKLFQIRFYPVETTYFESDVMPDI
jgi:hypothetical protein